MAFKFLIFFTVVAVANCGFIGAPYPYYGAPTLIKTIAPAPTVIKKIEIDPPAQYNFKYGVHDATTGDIKNQEETRDGHSVTGSYSLIDADGLKRTVDYTATPEGGFNAVVRREGIPIAPAPIVKKIIAPAPAYYHAPAYTKIIAAPAPTTTITKVIAAPAQAYTNLIRPGGFSYSISSPSYYNNYGW